MKMFHFMDFVVDTQRKYGVSRKVAVLLTRILMGIDTFQYGVEDGEILATRDILNILGITWDESGIALVISPL